MSGNDEIKVIPPELPTEPTRHIKLSPTSAILIFEPNNLRVIAPPLGDDPEGEVPPNVMLALTAADMLSDPAFVQMMFDMWEKKADKHEAVSGDRKTH